MVESVLVGVDHSEPSQRAVRFALRRALINDWHVRVVHVVNWSRWYDVPSLPELQRRPLAVQQERRAVETTLLKPMLLRMRQEGLADGMPVETAVEFGRPSEVLSAMAGNEGFGLVVVARTGESDLKQAIFGSTASRLVQHAPVPVLVVP